MSDTMQIITGLILVFCAFILNQAIVGLRVRRTARAIFKHLDLQKAYSPDSAIDLADSSPSKFRMGLRNFRPKAIEALIQADILNRTPAGKYYLKRTFPGL